MTQQELEKRKEKATQETLVIAPVNGGFKVYSPALPGKFYEVNLTHAPATCTCPDYESHQDDPVWKCKHIIAVIEQLEKPKAITANNNVLPDVLPVIGTKVRHGNGKDNNGKKPKNTPASKESKNAAQMLLKRSVSPDGRIDSLSVEFSCPVSNVSVSDIKTLAQKSLSLQSEIVAGFLEHQKPINSQPNNNGRHGNNGDNGRMPAVLLNIAGMNTRKGRSLFLNVQVNGNILKLFGNRRQLAEAIERAGFPDLTEDIEEGTYLNWPCLVTTKPSRDGRYVNIEEVFPDNRRA